MARSEVDSPIEIDACIVNTVAVYWKCNNNGGLAHHTNKCERETCRCAYEIHRKPHQLALPSFSPIRHLRAESIKYSLAPPYEPIAIGLLPSEPAMQWPEQPFLYSALNENRRFRLAQSAH